MNDFDQAVAAIIAGDTEVLQKLLQQEPQLIRAQATSEHRAMLLHYVAANGVEDELQKTPANIVEVARILLDAGADVDALAETYGGGSNQTTLNMLVSSVHPARAGVQADLVEVLADAGAAIEGLSDDGFPLQLAIDFGYTAAAQMLVQKGAQIRSASVAAGLGRADVLEALLKQVNESDLQSQLVLALSAACRHGQIAGAEVLLNRGVDIDAQPMQLGTGLHQAIFGEHIRMIRFLIECGADLSRKHTVYAATPLDFACHNGKASAVECLLEYSEEDLTAPLLSAVDQGHGEVVQRLLQQGARAAGALSLAQERDNQHVLDLLNAADK